RIRSSSAIVCGSSHDPCGPGTMHSDFAPSRWELQYGTTPSLLSASGPGLPRLPMIEWYGAWIDSLFGTARYGAFGARLLTLLGSLPLLIFLSVPAGISLFIVVTRSTGSDINFMANAP